MEGRNDTEYKSAWMKRKNETRSGTQGERHGDTRADGEKKGMHGGRANHGRERVRVCCQGKEEESEG